MNKNILKLSVFCKMNKINLNYYRNIGLLHLKKIYSHAFVAQSEMVEVSKKRVNGHSPTTKISKVEKKALVR